ncbi:MarR family transcriptional regulator [Saxibacter everestensis]|uniref:MarR family transcriptional regulator n=1 Tax=Saxibacter everestensis TaxID=2909229 RepID=A0ABY8QUR8_9MICO|nr:MarR family transcriptional regulator [Brevibacteriaceae bacterium ZFBP1038]
MSEQNTAVKTQAPASRRVNLARLASQLRIAVNRTSRRLRAEKSDQDVTDGQYGVLAYLFKEGNKTPRNLSDHERVQPPSMNRTINHLAEAGYVIRKPHPDDKRQILVCLSVAGREVVRETRRRRDAWLFRRLSELTPHQRRILDEASEILMEVAAK